MIRAGILTKKQESIRWQFFKVWLRGNIMGFGDMFLFFIFIILPFLVSIPAFTRLKNRGQLLLVDPFTHVFSAIFIVYMMVWFEAYAFAVASLGNLAAEPLASVVLAVIINYLKLLAPKRMSRWVLSFSSILVLFILTTIMWYFFPGMGD